MTKKNILIIGGTSGIGLELTKKVVAEGHNVIVASRNPSEELQKLGVTHITWDATQAVGDSFDTLPEEIHGLAYCPGTINLKPFQRLSEEEFMHDYQVNALGAVRVLQATMKQLRKSKGASVVLFSTVAVALGMNFHSSIAMAKSAVEGLTKSLAAEWAMHKVRVNALAPSLTDTPLAEKLLSSPEKKEASDKRHPIGRVGTSEDLANAALFLLSEQSSWVTGQIIGIDGGMGTLKP
jgi:NAD(P)-dependent dehydrogenase (short-subunit alcohol dehydrogenase family)